ncbi:MAG: aspartate/glutamate racemase family protein [Rhodospirillales bacterium]|nr:aspartate/glutamate racemase family protein [Rhodospirillales bacterium]
MDGPMDEPGAGRPPPPAKRLRAKIGVILPPPNTLKEAEWSLMAPEGVSVHATRMPLHDSASSGEGKRRLYGDIERAAGYLAEAGLDAIAYGCTAGSMVQPVSELGDFMGGISGVPCVTTAASLVAAAGALGAERIAIATPYHDALNEHEARFFTGAGFEVTNIAGLGIGADGPADYVRIARTDRDEIAGHAVDSDTGDADLLVISCTDLPVLGLIPELEDRLGKPVVTSNQATFWATLRAAGIGDRFEAFGALLKNH